MEMETEERRDLARPAGRSRSREPSLQLMRPTRALRTPSRGCSPERTERGRTSRRMTERSRSPFVGVQPRTYLEPASGDERERPRRRLRSDANPLDVELERRLLDLSNEERYEQSGELEQHSGDSDKGCVGCSWSDEHERRDKLTTKQLNGWSDEHEQHSKENSKGCWSNEQEQREKIITQNYDDDLERPENYLREWSWEQERRSRYEEATRSDNHRRSESELRRDDRRSVSKLRRDDRRSVSELRQDCRRSESKRRRNYRRSETERRQICCRSESDRRRSETERRYHTNYRYLHRSESAYRDCRRSELEHGDRTAAVRRVSCHDAEPEKERREGWMKRSHTKAGSSPRQRCRSVLRGPTPGKESTEELTTNMLKQFIDTIKTVGKSGKHNITSTSVANVVPDFDPLTKTQTIKSWITKVEECAEIYDWDERETIHYALPKLTGMAKTWYQSLPTVKYTWSEWKNKLVETFPYRQNYAEVLTEMLNLKVKFGEPLEPYYYSKLNLLNRCEIYGKNAVDCILFGVEDRAIKIGAQAGAYDRPEKVLGYLKTVKVGQMKEQPNNSRIDRDRPSNLQLDEAKGTNGPKPLIRCFNCGIEGHPSFKCPKPLEKCNNCNKLGHSTTACLKTSSSKTSAGE